MQAIIIAVSRADEGETTRCNQEHAARAEQGPDIHGERPDKHQCNVVGAADPSTIVKTDPQASFQVGGTERQHAARQCDNARTQDDTQNA